MPAYAHNHRHDFARSILLGGDDRLLNTFGFFGSKKPLGVHMHLPAPRSAPSAKAAATTAKAAATTKTAAETPSTEASGEYTASPAASSRP
jgi:hypothetical protein